VRALNELGVIVLAKLVEETLGLTLMVMQCWQVGYKGET